MALGGADRRVSDAARCISVVRWCCFLFWEEVWVFTSGLLGIICLAEKRRNQSCWRHRVTLQLAESLHLEGWAFGSRRSVSLDIFEGNSE